MMKLILVLAGVVIVYMLLKPTPVQATQASSFAAGTDTPKVISSPIPSIKLTGDKKYN